ncbi:MAG: lipoprotein signal peptidase [Muribaculaceae bacterium]|nr:lipoprotein signal peptidase [Muribaculaceae bacterium]
MSNNSENRLRAVRESHLGWLVAIIILLIVVADQWLKIWIKTNFYLGEDMEITSWFHLKFIENNGFAFGIEWFNKYILTFGRIIAVILFCWAMKKLIVNSVKYSRGFFIAFALIIAGAAGNIFDCIFYGEIFTNPMPPEVAEMFPTVGYAGWFEGRVVDMLYFPLFTIEWPDWMPGIGGHRFEFFQYIFNIADSAITVGVLMMIFFYSRQASEAINYLFDKKKDSKKNS